MHIDSDVCDNAIIIEYNGARFVFMSDDEKDFSAPVLKNVFSQILSEYAQDQMDCLDD